MMRWLLLLTFAVVAGLGAGCASTANDDKISTIPWNRPQSWEGTGALGGMRPPGAP